LFDPWLGHQHERYNDKKLVETEDEVFLKTIIPSRKATKRYLGGENKNG